jgi:hypothetical protein
MKMKKLLFGVLSLTVVFNPGIILADELSVSGNAEGSTNNVNVSSNNNTNVEQNNNANITNNVNLNANTGDNTANENNGGDTNIQTGDVKASSEIINAGINQSYANVGCCPTDTSANISGNGSGSNNTIAYNTNNNTTVTVNNNANIYNSVNGYANTGYNEVNYNNGGSVSIATGDITASDTIKNKSINIAQVKAVNGQSGSVYLAIKENAADSDNAIVLEDESEIEINIDNSANIVNKSEWDLNTGGNGANGNSGGDVEITTGDIVLETKIENTDVNVGIVDIDCCEEEKGGPVDGNPPPANPTPNNNGGNGGSGGNGGNGGSSSGGPAVTQAVLPVTGSPSLLVLALVNTIMFFMGWYLRLRSGRSPNLAI